MHRSHVLQRLPAQTAMERKVYYYLREQHGAGAVSSKYFHGMTQTFVKSIEDFAARVMQNSKRMIIQYLRRRVYCMQSLASVYRCTDRREKESSR